MQQRMTQAPIEWRFYFCTDRHYGRSRQVARIGEIRSIVRDGGQKEEQDRQGRTPIFGIYNPLVTQSVSAPNTNRSLATSTWPSFLLRDARNHLIALYVEIITLSREIEIGEGKDLAKGRRDPPCDPQRLRKLRKELFDLQGLNFD